VKFESDGRDFYLRSADAVQNPLAKSVFLALAEDEKDHIRRVREIYDELKRLAPDVTEGTLLVRVHPDVARALAGDEAELLADLRALVDGRLRLEGDPLLHHEQFDLVPR